MIEKRKYARIKDGAKVIYKVMGVKGEYPLHVLDIGAGGLRLPIKEKVKAGALIEFRISLDKDTDSFFGLAKVAWQDLEVKKDEKGNAYYETGIEFLRVGVDNRKRILRYILSQSNPSSKTAP